MSLTRAHISVCATEVKHLQDAMSQVRTWLPGAAVMVPGAGGFRSGSTCPHSPAGCSPRGRWQAPPGLRGPWPPPAPCASQVVLCECLLLTSPSKGISHVEPGHPGTSLHLVTSVEMQPALPSDPWGSGTSTGFGGRRQPPQLTRLLMWEASQPLPLTPHAQRPPPACVAGLPTLNPNPPKATLLSSTAPPTLGLPPSPSVLAGHVPEPPRPPVDSRQCRALAWRAAVPCPAPVLLQKERDVPATPGHPASAQTLGIVTQGSHRVQGSRAPSDTCPLARPH